MYPLRMIHAAHGAMTVYSVAERKSSEEKGWKVQTAEEYEAVLAAKRGVPNLPENPESVVELPRKPGRPRKA